MITSDYKLKSIESIEELNDLKSIADIELSNIILNDYPNLLVFPDSFDSYDRDLGKKVICSINKEKHTILTNSIVGFIGNNTTHLSIHSRFAEDNGQDYFLHYMLQKVAKVNIFNLKHTMAEDSVFDFLIYLFPLYLKKAINQGLYKKYVTHRYNDSNVKGIIDINRHIRYNHPFNGKIAYNTREYCYDNEITQLIRHTIEYIAMYANGKEVLSMDNETQLAISQVRDATPTYERSARQSIINKNIRSIAHPYYNEYTPLQRLCLQILRHEELKYGQEKNEIYGVLIDAAWLWEEYLAIVLADKYNHYLKERGKRFNLFENYQQIIPDYLSKDMSIVADAKYIPLNEEKNYGEEKATAIYYKTITYMYRFCTNIAYLLYPHPDKDVQSVTCKIKTELVGVNGGSIIKLGLRIPSNCKSFNEFVDKIEEYEKKVYNSL